MSYEGREEHICKNGHRWEIGCQYGEGPEPKCFCGAESVWCHNIDDTNCDAVGEIPEKEWEKFLISPVQTEECDKCHHVKVTAAPTYRVPTLKELRAMEHHYDYKTRELIPLNRGR